MGWFRSEKMEFVQIIVDKDNAYNLLHKLGRQGSMQFIDGNAEESAFDRRYASMIRKCDELERKLRYFMTELEQEGLPLNMDETRDLDRFMDFLEHERRDKPSTAMLDMLEDLLGRREEKVRELSEQTRQMQKEYNSMVELKHVLSSASLFSSSSSPDETSPLAGPDGMRFSHVAGVLNAVDRGRFERMVFRATRGNAYPQFSEIEHPIPDPETGRPVEKLVFVITFRSTAIEAKLRKICDAFGARTYEVPSLDDEAAISQQKLSVEGEIRTRDEVLKESRKMKKEYLRTVAEKMHGWRLTVVQEKSVFATLNMLKSTGSSLCGTGWVVARDLEAVGEIARGDLSQDGQAMMTTGTAPPTSPPTYFETNAFTAPFQELVDTYGVPRYREANPAFFAASLFPFLFGVMFGDVGHGSVIFLGALYLVMFESCIGANGAPKGVVMAGFFKIRYLLLLMGFFAVYCGFIYNDFFSLGLELFPSSYTPPPVVNGTATSTEFTSNGNVYPFGFDPVWHRASNDLTFLNSFKMKISVIIGVLHMMLGVFLKTANAVHFGSMLDLFFECIPQIIFLGGMFGYMDFLIIYKWCTNWATAGRDAPSLINTMISMVLSGGSVPTVKAADGSEVKLALYDGQESIQLFLLVLAFINVPIMLLPKPIIESRRASPHAHHAVDEEDAVPSASEIADAKTAEHEAHSFADLFIHQAIETIEFVLGSVSNTASYLRLWALSLAHAQLAKVFWERAFLPGITVSGGIAVKAIAIVISFALWAAITTGVLLIMDVMECFLHALRLQWVEFQNKFYKADGYKFAPFSFKLSFASVDADQ